jgi:hemerythrin-like domain-containing protein
MISIRSSPLVTLDTPIDHLDACHRRIEERLNTLERVGPHLCDRPDEARAALQAVFWFFDSSGVTHTADEEESFFPRLIPKMSPADREWLAALEADHLHAESLYDRLKSLVANLPAQPGPAHQAAYIEAAAELCAHYRAHIRREDERFSPLSRQHLSDADLHRISVEMKQRRGL